jgi:hypothetical protein
MARGKAQQPLVPDGPAAVEITDVQAIKHLRVELPEQGGVLVLQGKHGVGKTTGISCVSALGNKGVRADLRPRDGCEAGTIAAPGIVVRIGRRSTARGELECEIIDPEFDPSVLVDPKLKDEIRGDAHRLRMLVRLGQVVVPPDQWGGHLAGFIPDEAVGLIVAGLDPLNPCEAAECIRVRVHEMALGHEQEAARQDVRAGLLAGELEGVDLLAPHDAAALQRAYEEALGLHSRVMAERRAADRQRAAVEDASQRLAAVESSLPDLLAIERVIYESEATRTQLQAGVVDLDAQIAALRRTREDLVRGVDEATRAGTAARGALAAGKQQHEAVASLRATVEAGTPSGPADHVIEAARIAKEAAHASILAGERVRKAHAVHVDAELAQRAARAAETRARELRGLARSTDMVLEEALRDAGFLGLTWRDERLYVESDRGLDGHLELFQELSEGERYQWAFRWIAQKLAPGSFVPLDQEAWQGLNRPARLEIARLCRELRVWLWTGEIGEGELRTTVYGVEYSKNEEG